MSDNSPVRIKVRKYGYTDVVVIDGGTKDYHDATVSEGGYLTVSVPGRSVIFAAGAWESVDVVHREADDDTDGGQFSQGEN